MNFLKDVTSFLKKHMTLLCKIIYVGEYINMHGNVKENGDQNNAVFKIVRFQEKKGRGARK